MTHRGPFQLNQLSDSVVLKAGSVFTEIILSNNKIVKKKNQTKKPEMFVWICITFVF